MTVQEQMKAFVECGKINKGNNNETIHRYYYDILMYYNNIIAVKQGDKLYILDDRISLSVTRRKCKLAYYGVMNNLKIEYLPSNKMNIFRGV